MGKKLLLTLAILSLSSELISATSVICYHGTWSQYRTGNGQFSVSAVPANLCTHYMYAFVGLDSTTNEVILLDEWLDINLNGFADAIALKTVNPSLKVILAVGGWSEGSAKYSAMASDATARSVFIQSALKIVQTYGFDGFDLDWEYPARRDSSNTADKKNFATLIKEMYAVFNPLGLLLTAAVSATPSSVDTSYDVASLSEYLDFINVMTYDFHGAWDTTTSHNSPLYSAARFVGTEYEDYSVNASIMGWISRGAAPSKIALGVPFYGRTVLLADSSSTGVGATTTSTGGAAGPYTATSGYWGYNEIVEQFNAGGWTEGWDDEQQVPYAYSGSTWLTFDNAKSLTIKTEYAKSLGLGAIMLWSIETEDFLALSGTQYPLLTAINTALGTTSSDNSSSSGNSSDSSSSSNSTSDSSDSLNSSDSASSSDNSSSSDSSSSSGSSSSSDSSSIANANSCTAEGYFRCTTDCTTYYYCQLVNGVYVGTALSCGSALYFDTTTNICNWPSAVSC